MVIPSVHCLKMQHSSPVADLLLISHALLHAPAQPLLALLCKDKGCGSVEGSACAEGAAACIMAVQSSIGVRT